MPLATSVRGPEAPGRRAALVAAWAAGAVGLGVLYPLSALAISPLVLPALAVVAALAVVSASRPHVGVAAALAIAPLGAFGVSGQILKLFLLGWSIYLFGLALLRGRAARSSPGVPRLTIVLTLYLAIAVVAFALTSEPTEARRLMRTLITGLLLFGTVSLSVREREHVAWILGGASLAALLVGGLATLDYVRGTGTDGGFLTNSGEVVSRVTAGFAHPNQLGGFLVLLVPLGIAGALLHQRARLLHAGGVVLAIGGIYASFSRGALIGLVLVPFIFLRGRRALFIVPVVLLVGGLGAPNLLKERFATLTSSGGEASTRVDIWRSALQIGESHPIAGVGLGGFPRAYANARIAGKAFLPQTIFEPPPHAHNLFLHLFAEEGLLGLLALLAVVTAATRATLALRRAPDRWTRVMGSGLLAALVAFLVHNQFDVTLFDVSTAIEFWALLGLISAVPELAPAPRAAE